MNHTYHLKCLRAMLIAENEWKQDLTIRYNATNHPSLLPQIAESSVKIACYNRAIEYHESMLPSAQIHAMSDNSF